MTDEAKGAGPSGLVVSAGLLVLSLAGVSGPLLPWVLLGLVGLAGSWRRSPNRQQPDAPSQANRPHQSARFAGRPYPVSKKWKNVWTRLLYCSDRCRPTNRNG